MKNFLLPLVACLVASSTYAQTSSESEESLKASQKKWALELNVNPFKNDLNLSNAVNQIKARAFLSDRTALRLGFHANRLSSDVEEGSPYGVNPMNYRDEKSSTTLGFNIGLEKHLVGTRRLSPYFGVDLAVSNKSSKQELTSGSSKTTIKNAWTTYSSTTSVWIPDYNGSGGQYVTQPIYRTEELGYVKYGLNFVSGFDYYISKHFFLGAELSLGFSQTNHKDIKVTQSGGSSGSGDNSDQKNKSFQFGTSNYNGIRLGYVL